jgi:hypothetical protein
MNCKKISSAVVLFLSILTVIPAYAHIGPPFPIIENKKVGPVVIALWTHPDIGQGAFYVMIDPVPGSAIPNDLKVKIGIQPESGRLPETFYNAQRDDTKNQVVYKAFADFDRDEFYKVHLVIESAQSEGDAFSRVEATPTVMGRFGLIFFAMPFVLVGGAWFYGVNKKRKQLIKRRQAAQANKATPVNR